MGATDNSFIKAFDQQPDQKSVERPPLRGVYVDSSSSITVTTPFAIDSPARDQAVSHLYAAADRIRSKAVTIRNAAAAEALSANGGVRVDGGDPVLPPPPHIDAELLAKATSAEVTPQLPPETTVDNPDPPNQPVEVVPDPMLNVIESPPITTEHTTHAVPAPYAMQDVHDEPAEPWRAQWEVDRFIWPPVVEQMYETWAGELSAIIRPLLTAAWQGANVIAVTSFNRGEGATTTAMSLARMAASFRVPVAVIDGDLAAPSIGESLGMAFGQGWNTLPTALPLSEAAIASASDRLVVVPACCAIDRENETNIAYHALDELSKNFELVILDAGPIYTAARKWFEGPAAEKIHGTLVVQDIRNTTSEQIEDVCSRLGEVGVEQVAIVENFQKAA